MLTRSHVLAAALVLPLLCGAQAHAQTQSPPPAGCVEVPKQSPTQTEKGSHSGTQNMGSTGWTGGQTNQKKTQKDQPATAQGLDPTKPDQNKSTGC